jgi:hypothetical protein
MTEMVKRFAPGYPVKQRPPRRGDRLAEPLIGKHETYKLDDNLMIIDNPHDHPAKKEEKHMIPDRNTKSKPEPVTKKTKRVTAKKHKQTVAAK